MGRSGLLGLAGEVLSLSDEICWGLLEHGDLDAFRRCAETAAQLAELIEAADLSTW